MAVRVQVLHQNNPLANMAAFAVIAAAIFLTDIPCHRMVMRKTGNHLPVVHFLQITEVEAVANHIVIFGLTEHQVPVDALFVTVAEDAFPLVQLGNVVFAKVGGFGADPWEYILGVPLRGGHQNHVEIIHFLQLSHVADRSEGSGSFPAFPGIGRCVSSAIVIDFVNGVIVAICRGVIDLIVTDKIFRAIGPALDEIFTGFGELTVMFVDVSELSFAAEVRAEGIFV